MFIIATVLLTSIITGDAQANANISSNVSGGSVQTKITTSVNGQINTVESDKPGTIKVENHNGVVKVQSSEEASPSIKIAPIVNRQKFFILNYLKEFVNLLGHLLGWKT